MTNLGLYDLFIRKDKTAWSKIVTAAVVAGVMQGLVVVIINEAAGNIIHGGLNFRLLLLFLATIGAYSLANHYSTSRTIALTERIIFSRYVGIADNIRNANALEYESIGKQTVYSTLEVNTDIILEMSKTLAGIGAGAVMILFCAVYIASLSLTALAVVIAFYIFGIFVYTENLKRAQTLLKKAAAAERVFKSLFRHIVEGFKEIRVNSKKSDDIYGNYIASASDDAMDAGIEAEKSLTVNSTFIQSFYYTIVAAMIFLLPQISNLEPLVIVKIAAIVLFSYGSMTRIVNHIPLLLKSEKAVTRLDELDKRLKEAQDSAEPFSNRFRALHAEQAEIRLQGVRFTYPNGGDVPEFTLGPVSLNVKPGEILFIVGGNGSGKTTLLKIIAGLYYPQEGRLFLGDTQIGRESYTDYRNRISVVFPDYYLFDRFYGVKDVDKKALQEIIRTMQLENHVFYEEGKFNDFRLSAGLSKRMALLCSHMENKPVLVIDEVAADLDPAFRKFFYEHYLSSLKKAGITVIAVSHDEKYFHVADHLVKMESGKIITNDPGNA